MPNRPNQAWFINFVADQLPDGTRFRALTIANVFPVKHSASESDKGYGPGMWSWRVIV